VDYQERIDLEDKVRRRLQRKLKTTLPETLLTLPGRKRHRFDLVSPDRRIVDEIKTSEPNRRRKSSQLRPATIGDLSKDCLLLLGRRAKTRIFVITDRIVYEKFLDSPHGQVCLAKGIRILDKELRI
jgi:hypothetical protein